jgi:metallo-beta-lactamase family protein
VRGHTFLAHGEPEGLEGLRDALIKAGADPARLVIPRLDEQFVLTKGAAAASPGPSRILPTAAARPDWHNARARLLLDLNARLDALPTTQRARRC